MAKSTVSTKSKTAKKTTRGTSASKASASKGSSTTRSKAAKEKVTVERRTSDRRSANPVAAALPLERREKVNRRRQIDPTTCERDYSDDEVEFMNALDLYKRKSGRMFPTCSEVLEVIRGLGYVKSPSELLPAIHSAAYVSERADCQEFGMSPRNERLHEELESLA